MQAVPVEQTADEIDRVIANTQNKQLRSKPGEVYDYSNFGYCLLGYIIEKTSGQPYASLLQDYIFGPLA
jgi:CubicO group peptidase (beta-lactamase class C family)